MTGWQVAGVFAGIPILAFSAIAVTITIFSRSAPAPMPEPTETPAAAQPSQPPPTDDVAASEVLETVELEEERP